MTNTLSEWDKHCGAEKEEEVSVSSLYNSLLTLPYWGFNPTKRILIKMTSWVDSPGAEPEMDTLCEWFIPGVISGKRVRDAQWGRDIRNLSKNILSAGDNFSQIHRDFYALPPGTRDGQ